MRIEPTPPPSGNFPSGGSPSLSAAAEATLFAQLATLAPTAAPQAAAATPTGQQMTPQQINTYWLFRALSDFSMLALTQNGHYPSTAYQPYLKDLQYMLAQSNPPLALDPSIMKDLTTYTTGTNYTNIPAQMGNIENDFMTIMTGGGSNPGNYDFTSFNQDQMFYFYTFQMAFALTNGAELNDFWSHGGQTSAMGASMGQFITTYFYERNLDPSSGTENYAGLKNDLSAFMAQFNPMITAYGAGFQQDFPDLYNALNGGSITNPPIPFAGLLKDITGVETPGTWPYTNDSPAPTVPLETPPPPWDNPNSTIPPNFIYPTSGNDPGCNFFYLVDGYLSSFFQS